MSGKRYIDIDTDTRIGYNYIKGSYYITNKGYTTYRTTVQEIQSILNAMNITNIQDSEILALREEIEQVHDIYFTWDDTGSYIRTIQFNDHTYFPLEIDCTKKKIYIRNSNVVYDLDINESMRLVRVPYFCSFYAARVGLQVSNKDMTYFYSLLHSYYTPTVYNQINKAGDTIYYGDTFLLSNFNNKSKVVYHGVYNALKGINYSNAASIESIEASPDIITLTEANTSIVKGSKIQVINTPNIEGYNADGYYTVSKVTDNALKVSETIPVSYTTPYNTCSIVAEELTITSISREDQTITLSEDVPNTILIGDKITLEGTSTTTPYETVSCDGTYTVFNIEGDTITTQESLPTNYSEGSGTLFKGIFIGNVLFQEENLITLTRAALKTANEGDTIIVKDSEGYVKGKYTAVSAATDTITVEETLEPFTQEYPVLKLGEPSTETLIGTTYSEVSSFPTGDFLLDTFEQAASYIGTIGEGVPVPTASIKENIYKEVPSTYSIEETDTGITNMKLLGLYSYVYQE